MNTLLRIAQADSYAIAVEYVDRQKHSDLFEKLLKFEAYQQHPTYHKLRPGEYSDDTQMSIAIAEYLIKSKAFSKADLTAAFFDTFKRDPIDGYSRNFQSLLEKSLTVEELISKLDPTSDKNGAAMRSVPIGYLPNLSEVVPFAKSQAQITHNSVSGIYSSALIAIMSHFARSTTDDFDQLHAYVLDSGVDEKHFLSNFFNRYSTPWTGSVSVKNPLCKEGLGLATAHAVYTLLCTKKSLLDIMTQVIEWGGDTDSVAAIAWGIASFRYDGFELPEFFYTGLRNNSYGRDYLNDLDIALNEVYGAT